MRKFFLFATAVFAFTSISAQDLLSKRGEPILPQAGDYAISVDASPFLDYFGNFIGGDGLNVSPTFDFTTVNQVITFKYFKTDKMAYRSGVRLGLNSNKFAISADDYQTNGTSDIGLLGGLEFRRGNTRLQAYYGAEAGISLNSVSSSWDYKNKLSSTYTNAGVARDVKTNFGSTFGFGLRGFGGVEYFILPKISVGGEFGWGLTLASTGIGKKTTEEWSGTAVVKKETEVGVKSSVFSLDTDNLNSIFGPAGTLRLNFYF